MIAAIGSPEIVQSLEYEVKASGEDYRVDYESVPCKIERYLSDPQDGTSPDLELQSTWTMARESGQKTVWEHPEVLAILRTWGLPQVALFKYNVDAIFLNPSQEMILKTIMGIEDEFTTALDEVFKQWPILKTMVLDLAFSTGTFFESNFVVRNTIIIPAEASIGTKYKFDYDSVKRTVTSSQLESLEPTIPFKLPADRYWLTLAPEQDQRTDGKLQVVREWTEIDLDTYLDKLKYKPL